MFLMILDLAAIDFAIFFWLMPFMAAGAWCCTHIWDRYAFSGDKAVLEEYIDVMTGAAKFFLDFLVEDPRTGYLVTCPSNSPENEFYYIDANGEKQESMFTEGATIDFQIIYALFTRTVHACKVLNKDEEFSKNLQVKIAKPTTKYIGSLALQLINGVNSEALICAFLSGIFLAVIASPVLKFLIIDLISLPNK